MAKWYVRSGELRTIIIAGTPMDAVVNAIRKAAPGTKLAKATIVGEKGFDDNHDDDLLILTEHVLALI